MDAKESWFQIPGFYSKLILIVQFLAFFSTACFSAICNGKVANGDVTLSRGRSLPVMTNGINTKTDLDLIMAKEASRRGLKLTDLDSRNSLKANNTLDGLSGLCSKKNSEDHNLNELNKLSLEGMAKSSKGGGQQNRSSSFGVVTKNGKRNSAYKGSERFKDFVEQNVEHEESDSDSLSASSCSMNNSRKNSRSSSPKVSVKTQTLRFTAPRRFICGLHFVADKVWFFLSLGTWEVSVSRPRSQSVFSVKGGTLITVNTQRFMSKLVQWKIARALSRMLNLFFWSGFSLIEERKWNLILGWADHKHPIPVFTVEPAGKASFLQLHANKAKESIQ